MFGLHHSAGKEVNHPMAVRSALARLARLFARARGQGLAEYALILALIALAAILSMIFMGQQVSDKFSVIGSTIDGVTP
jgi:Flp pilus assembly pilin Flp